MNTGRLLGVRFALATLLLIQAPGSLGWAQAGSYTKLNAKGQKAYSVPISDKVVKLELTLPSGKLAEALIKEGGMVKFGDLDQGYAFALVPVIKDVAKQSVSFSIFRLTQDKDGNESIAQLEKAESNADASISTKTEPSFQIRVVSIGDANSASLQGKPKACGLGAQAKSEAKTDPKKDCCLACDQVWVCALCVWMDCGCCCDAPRRCQQP